MKKILIFIMILCVKCQNFAQSNLIFKDKFQDSISNKKNDFSVSLFKFKSILTFSSNINYELNRTSKSITSLSYYNNTLDFNVGIKTFNMISINKGFLFDKRKCLFKSNFGIGPHYYQFSFEELNFRNLGISIKNSTSYYFKLKKINIGIGFIVSIGYGYQFNYTNLQEYKYKITTTLTPLIFFNF